MDFARVRQNLLDGVLLGLPTSVDRTKASDFLGMRWGEKEVALGVSNNWSMLVPALLAGKRLTVGSAYENSMAIPLPPAGAPVAFAGTFRTSGAMPCFEGDQNSKCAWLEQDAAPNRESLGDALQKVVDASDEPGSPKIRLVGARYRTEQVLERDRLVPHWFHMIQTVDISSTTMGKTAMIHLTQERTDAFHYLNELQ